jgi:predicted translin family RNA/ssDNA-binding protein
MNEKLEQLLKQKAEIEEQIKLIEQENKKWEPVGGDYCVFSDGEIDKSSSLDKSRLFGTERPTQEQAEKARDKMRVFNKLLAYHDEFCADYEFVKNKNNYFVYFDENNKIYDLDYNDAHYTLGVVYFNYEIARELVDKLNSGEVEL